MSDYEVTLVNDNSTIVPLYSHLADTPEEMLTAYSVS
jgi:hypothetical protein